MYGKAIMCRTEKYKYVCRLYEEDELCDLEKDPHEVSNCIRFKEYKGILLSMKERLISHYLNTCDVVPFEKDARIEKGDGIFKY